MRASVFAVLVVAGVGWGQVEPVEGAGGRRVQASARSAETPAAPRARDAARSDRPDAAMPAGMVPAMMGVVREFAGGHQDLRPARVPGRHAGIVGDALDDDGKPVFVSRGYRVLRPGRDAAGEPVIGPRRYIERRRGDQAPRVVFVEGEAVESARSLDGWFRDMPGVNRVSVRQVDFLPSASAEGEHVAEIDLGSAGETSGARARPRTLELHGRFAYRQGAGDWLRFACADDLWVFIDGRLVVDLGGTGAASAGAEEPDAAEPGDEPGDEAGQTARQSVQLDRLLWLRDGSEYEVKVFCAARGEGSPVRIESTVWPGSAPAPALAGVSPAPAVNE